MFVRPPSRLKIIFSCPLGPTDSTMTRRSSIRRTVPHESRKSPSRTTASAPSAPRMTAERSVAESLTMSMVSPAGQTADAKKSSRHKISKRIGYDGIPTRNRSGQMVAFARAQLSVHPRSSAKTGSATTRIWGGLGFPTKREKIETRRCFNGGGCRRVHGTRFENNQVKRVVTGMQWNILRVSVHRVPHLLCCRAFEG